MSELDGKAQFDDVYFENSPHSYLRAMSQVGYYLPDQTLPYYENIIENLIPQRDSIRILDVGSSYGVNAALLKHSFSMQTLYNLFLTDRSSMNSEDLQEFFEKRIARPELTFYGLDISEPAVRWATTVGLCSEGFACDIESHLTQELRESLPEIDLVVSTGCIGYLGAKGIFNLFSEIAKNKRRPRPPFAFSALRMVDLAAIEEALSLCQYRLTRVNKQPFLQRNFADSTEKESLLQNLHSKGVTTSQFEETGGLYANFYVASSF